MGMALPVWPDLREQHDKGALLCAIHPACAINNSVAPGNDCRQSGAPVLPILDPLHHLHQPPASEDEP